ncbi:MAG: PEP-CTERM sorting domain-containing protein [Gammaproteobacteria bacterium]|nr:MAG: PEP-CTERM sorting domain-containing protein [Gammaproteobacteria bacterium]
MALKQLTAGLLAFGIAGTAVAAPSLGGLQTVFDNITQGGPSSVDVTTDMLNDNVDTTWAIGGTGGAVSTLIIELAGFKDNTSFGIYSGTETVELFGGPDGAGAQVLMSILGDGSVIVNFTDTLVDFAGNSFGFYLDSSASNGGGMFYSDTAKNADGVDHMFAYQGVGDTVEIPPYAAGVWGPSEYILAWEDLNGGGDEDYADFVVMVESVNPIPEPGLAALLGAGLVGVGLSRRKNRAA